MSYLHLCHASAGSGKTHMLVQHYLTLALASPTDFPRLLAITFTNKATEELQERILKEVGLLAKGVDTQMAQGLGEKLGYPPDVLQARAKALLSGLLHRYEAWGVYTVDGFTQHLLRAFADELGLCDYVVEMDQHALLERVIAGIISRLPQDKKLRAELTAWAAHRLRLGRSWDFRRELMTLGHEVVQAGHTFSWLYPSEGEQHRGEGLDKSYEELKARQEEMVRTCAQLAARGIKALREAGLQEQDLAWGRHGPQAFWYKLQRGEWAPPSQRVRRAARESTAWGRKSGPAYDQVTALAQACLQPLMAETLAYWQAHYPAYMTLQALLPLRYAIALGASIRKGITQAQEEEGLLLLTEATAQLKGLLEQAPPDFIYGKLGRSYQGIFIDEFQDLSQAQWRGFSPLVQHSFQHGLGGWLVGDVKQAIYRWRGGDADLFLHQVQEQVGSQHVRELTLPFNWRSQAHIVAFNNSFFAHAAGLLEGELRREISNAAADPAQAQTWQERWVHLKKAYAHGEQQVAPHKGKGHVALYLLPKRDQEGRSWEEVALGEVVARSTALQQAGYAPDQIAILVRNHREAERVGAAFKAQELQGGLPGVVYDVATAQAFTLGQSPYVRLFFAALEHCYAPEAATGLVTLVHLYQQYGAPPEARRTPAHYLTRPLDRPALMACLPKGWRCDVAAWRHLPLSWLFILLRQALGLTQPAARPYLEALDAQLDSLHEHEGKTLEGLLGWWRRKGTQVKLPPGGRKQALPVMTVHQSKGLGFRAVLVPFCAWPFDHPPHKPLIKWVHGGPAPFPPKQALPVYYGRQLLESTLVEGYFAEKSPTYLEQLNLLYVAFTRAKEGLYIFAPQGEGERISHAGHLVDRLVKKRILPWEQESWGEGWRIRLGELPTPKLSRGLAQAQEKGSPAPAQQDGLLSLSPAPCLAWSDWLAKIAPPSPAQQEGEWWHELLAQIERLDELPGCLARLAGQGLVSPAQLAKAEQVTASWRADPRISDWFSGRWKVKTEAALLLPGGQRLRPDRVLVGEQEGVVIDFKTGKPTPKYVAQVKAYTHHLQALLGKPVRGYLLYLFTGQVVACA